MTKGKSLKQFLAALLCAALMFTMAPVVPQAAETESTYEPATSITEEGGEYIIAAGTDDALYALDKTQTTSKSNYDYMGSTKKMTLTSGNIVTSDTDVVWVCKKSGSNYYLVNEARTTQPHNMFYITSDGVKYQGKWTGSSYGSTSPRWITLSADSKLNGESSKVVTYNATEHTFSGSSTASDASVVRVFKKKTEEAATKYSVTYNANGGEGTVTDANEYDADATVTVKAGTGLSKEGYAFDGWNTKEDGTGTTYAAGATFKISADTTLFAQWEKQVIKVTGVTLNPTTASVVVGGTVTLTANVAPANADNKNVTWSSNDETVATVANGVVTGVKAGNATITVKTVDGEFTAECAVTVTAAPEPTGDKYYEVTSLTVDGDYIIAVGTGSTVNALSAQGGSTTDGSVKNAVALTVVDYVATDNNNIIWTFNASTKRFSNGSNQLYFSSSGLKFQNDARPVTYANGKLYGTDTNSNPNKNYYLTFNTTFKTSAANAEAEGATVRLFKKSATPPAPVAVTGVTLSPTTASVAVGGTATLTANVAPANADNKNVTWSSNDTSVATVANGVVTGVKAGNATITVKTVDGGFTAECAVTVTAAPEPTGDKYYEAGSLTDGDYIIAVGTGSTVNALSAQGGSTTDGSVKNAVALTVVDDDVDYVATDNNNIIWTFNASTKRFSNGSNQLYFSSSGLKFQNDARPVTYENGKLYGTATDKQNQIYYLTYGTAFSTTDNVADGATVRLFKKSATPPAPVAVTGVSVSPTTASVAVGGTATLTANVAPTNADNKNVTWSSDDETVATVANGVVTGVAEGTAKITVTTEESGFTAECEVTVTAAPVPTEEKYYKVDDLTEAGKYVLAVEGADGKIYAISTEKASTSGSTVALQAIELNTTSGAIDAVDPKAEWNCVKSGDNYYFNDGNGNWFYICSDGIKYQGNSTSDARNVVYDPATGTMSTKTTSSTFAVYYADGVFKSIEGAANGSSIALYKLTDVPATPVAVTGVNLNQTTASVAVGSTVALTANVTPSNATNKKVAWSSDVETVATVVNGVVTGVAEGTAKITVTTDDGGFTAECEVTVTAAPVPTEEKYYKVDDLTEAGKYVLAVEGADGKIYAISTETASTSGSTVALKAIELNTTSGAIDAVDPKAEWNCVKSGDNYYFNDGNGNWFYICSDGIKYQGNSTSDARNVVYDPATGTMSTKTTSSTFAVYYADGVFKSIEGAANGSAIVLYKLTDVPPTPVIIEYNVTFNMNGHGSVVTSGQKVESGKKAAKPADPTDAKYIFGGWFKEAACTNAWDFDVDVVTADVTLYAKWTVKSDDQDPTAAKEAAAKTFANFESQVYLKNYLTAQQNEILNLVKAYKAKVEAATTKAEVDTLMAQFDSAAKAIPTAAQINKVKLTKVTLKSVKVAKKKRLAVTWKPNKAVFSGYQIQYKISNKKSWKRVSVKKAATKKTYLKKLKKGKKYKVRIRGFKTFGKTVVYGKFSKTKKSKKVK